MSEAKLLACPKCKGTDIKSYYVPYCWVVRCDYCKVSIHGFDQEHAERLWREVAGGRQPDAIQTPEPSTLASETCSAAPCPSCEIYRKQWLNALDEGDNNKKLCDNLAGVLVAADGDDLIGIVETIIKQRDEASATVGKVMAWLENEAVKLDEGIKKASTHADHNRVCRLHRGIVTISRLKDYLQQVQQNGEICQVRQTEK